MFGPSDFSTFGRYVETPTGHMSPEVRYACGITNKLRDLVVFCALASWC
jgi:hypothetical protein